MGTIVGWGKSFRRQRTRDKWGRLPSTPLSGVVFLPHITTGSIWGCVLVVWGIVLSVSSSYLYIGLLVVGGIYFFLKIFLGVQ